jgi:hypothetical protein
LHQEGSLFARPLKRAEVELSLNNLAALYQDTGEYGKALSLGIVSRGGIPG